MEAQYAAREIPYHDIDEKSIITKTYIYEIPFSTSFTIETHIVEIVNEISKLQNSQCY